MDKEPWHRDGYEIANWTNLERYVKDGNATYCYGSTASHKMPMHWYRAFRKEAEDHGWKLTIDNGIIYLIKGEGLQA